MKFLAWLFALPALVLAAGLLFGESARLVLGLGIVVVGVGLYARYGPDES